MWMFSCCDCWMCKWLTAIVSARLVGKMKEQIYVLNWKWGHRTGCVPWGVYWVGWKNAVVFRECARVENLLYIWCLYYLHLFRFLLPWTGVVCAKWLCLNHHFLRADEAAAVSSSSDLLQLISLTLRLDQTLPLLSPELPQSEFLSLPATFLSGDKINVLLSAIYGVPLDFSTLLYVWIIAHRMK